ncbi:unnamed protein product [Cuscuta epithymum]|uniref:Uncharacterized protein n=1 Tax=Cuscuta epithymum TaxID=186058 RepID=A0AAV0C2S1_9ASTE|nr:unnamed protein product [Cuscuta epithymum]
MDEMSHYRRFKRSKDIKGTCEMRPWHGFSFEDSDIWAKQGKEILWQSDNCNFFLWEHDSKKMESRVSMDAEKQSVLDENERLRKELEAMKIENKILLEKICKLRVKKIVRG